MKSMEMLSPAPGDSPERKKGENEGVNEKRESEAQKEELLFWAWEHVASKNLNELQQFKEKMIPVIGDIVMGAIKSTPDLEDLYQKVSEEVDDEDVAIILTDIQKSEVMNNLKLDEFKKLTEALAREVYISSYKDEDDKNNLELWLQLPTVLQSRMILPLTDPAQRAVRLAGVQGSETGYSDWKEFTDSLREEGGFKVHSHSKSEWLAIRQVTPTE